MYFYNVYEQESNSNLLIANTNGNIVEKGILQISASTSFNPVVFEPEFKQAIFNNV
jgi:hypothetical protein